MVIFISPSTVHTAPISKYGTSANSFASTTLYGVFFFIIFFGILCSSDPEIIKTIRDYVVVGSGPFRMLSELTLSTAGPALAIITEIFYSGDERGVPGLLQRHQCQRRPGLLLRPDGEDGLETLNSSIITSHQVSVFCPYTIRAIQCAYLMSQFVIMIIITSDGQANLHCNI